MERVKMLINGEWVGDFNSEWIEVYNPSNGEKLTEIVNAEHEHIDLAVSAARAAFESKEWQDFKPYERGQLLMELANYIRENKEELAELECLDVGKPISQARNDIEAAARYFEFYAGAADKLMGDSIPIENGLLDVTVYEPMGVTAHIIPWNYPIQITARSVAAAIATGNAVIVKSAEDTPLTTNFLAKWFAESKLPKGIFQHVTGLGAKPGSYLVSHKDIDQITFTGSVNTGISVMQAAAANVTPVTLELGGKSPNIVFNDADLDKAATGVVNAIIQNAGQTCSAGSRLLVHDGVREPFLNKLVEKFARLTIGQGIDDPDIGPILNKRQYERILAYLEIGKKEGSILFGGSAANVENAEGGNYITPTIIDGLSPDSKLAQEEIFGPVLTIFTFHDIEEAIKLANGTDYGLVAGVWSQDIDTAHYTASRVRAGQVFINNYGAGGGIQMPFGGYKKSGIGREKGFEALRNYVQLKNIAVKYGRD
ncbi:aldehyde dehydrogenase family protein [Oceanobacillus piezotolerans]|uniref:Aldehyde dehydrogenase n=1 Tax=Oceanobacillus piezotolerans TaxID=2448030 RepID=A0A498DLY5_9BACI|nr:aldehyde dehydrogenase family protein [Oceanobacillus piezotolerans]RLL43979.1 aldehyde dehydrogenase family protein [Oceanobacillus piezotolerans]